MNRDHVRSGKAPFGLKKNAVWLRKNAAAEACFLDGITLFTLLQEQP
jgi:hypothetical protein